MKQPSSAALALAALALAACADAAPIAGPEAAAEARRVAPAPAGTGRVYVVHGIVGTDVAAALPADLPVDVEVNGACAITDFTFGSIAGPLDLPAGSYDIRVRLDAAEPCGGPAAISVDGVALSAGANVSIVAHLDANGAPTASIFANDLRRAPGRALVEPRHAAAAPAVDVLVDGAVAYAAIVNGQDVAPAAIRPGDHAVAINLAGTPTTVLSTILNPRPFTFTAAYVVGSATTGSLQFLVQEIPIDPAR